MASILSLLHGHAQWTFTDLYLFSLIKAMSKCLNISHIQTVSLMISENLGEWSDDYSKYSIPWYTSLSFNYFYLGPSNLNNKGCFISPACYSDILPLKRYTLIFKRALVVQLMRNHHVYRQNGNILQPGIIPFGQPPQKCVISCFISDCFNWCRGGHDFSHTEA